MFLFLGRTDETEILVVEAEGRVNQMVQLEPDDKGRSKHDDGDGVLQDDEHLSKHHLRMEAEIALHDVDGLKAGNMPRGQNARNNARQQDEAQADADSARIDIFRQLDPSPEQRGYIFAETECQRQAEGERHRNHQRRFGDQFQRNLILAAAEKSARGHLLGAESRVGDRQVDIVAQGEEEDGEDGSQQDTEPRLVALMHARAIVLRSKKDILERCHGDLVIRGPKIVIGQMIFHHLHLIIERRSWL